MSRLTRSMRIKSARITRKKQRGGVDEWYHTGFSDELLENFQKKLEEVLDIETVKKMMALVNPEKMGSQINNWFEVNRYQDILMRVGLEIALEKIPNPIEYIKTVTDQSKDINNMVSIFKDLEGVISLGVGTDLTEDIKSSAAPTNKFEMIFKDRKERGLEISKLLLNPKRIENLLVQAVAQIIYMLHDDKNYEETLGPTDNELLKENLINKWTYYVVNYVQNESNAEIRDSWVLGDEPINIDDIRVFWTQFIDELKKDASLITESDDNGILAAKLLRVHKEKKDILDISNFDGKIEYIEDDMPPETEIKGTLLEHVGVHSASFLLHLDGSIKVVMRQMIEPVEPVKEPVEPEDVP